MPPCIFFSPMRSIISSLCFSIIMSVGIRKNIFCGALNHKWGSVGVRRRLSYSQKTRINNNHLSAWNEYLVDWNFLHVLKIETSAVLFNWNDFFCVTGYFIFQNVSISFLGQLLFFKIGLKISLWNCIRL